jgi:GNAT superfamily N-acetyltransferase
MTGTGQSIEAHELDALVSALSQWQVDGMPVQLHPGDLGWHWRFGVPTLLHCLRVWRDGARVRAVGMLDGEVIRMGLAPEADADEAFAKSLADELTDPQESLFGAPVASIEARFGQALQGELDRRGWLAGEPWTPLIRELSDPVPDGGLDVRVIGPEQVDDRVFVQRTALTPSVFTVEQWHAMAQGSPYRQGRCLVGYNTEGVPVAAATVWSAGAGRGGLIEPMGTDREHRGHGYGRAITLAAAAALRELGASRALVATETFNAGAVPTYESAGFVRQPTAWDYRRPNG